MARQAIIRKQLKLFARVGELHRAGGMILNEQALKDPVEALAQFVTGYAYARRGGAPSYGPIAGEVIRELGQLSGFWEDPNSPKKIWDRFCKELGDLKSNPKVNPLCCKGFPYTTKHGEREIRQLSAVQFAQRLKEHDYNLVVWAKINLEQDQVSSIHSQLCGINGIGPKIASLFLKEVARCFCITPSRDRALLQPIDIWVRRAVQHMDQRMDSTKDEKITEWIVRKAQKAGVSPEAVNDGLWYLGAVIAGSEYRLFEVLDSPEQMEPLVVEHIEKMERQVRTWRQG